MHAACFALSFLARRSSQPPCLPGKLVEEIFQLVRSLDINGSVTANSSMMHYKKHIYEENGSLKDSYE